MDQKRINGIDPKLVRKSKDGIDPIYFFLYTFGSMVTKLAIKVTRTRTRTLNQTCVRGLGLGLGNLVCEEFLKWQRKQDKFVLNLNVETQLKLNVRRNF